jgi:hypothetical protein
VTLFRRLDRTGSGSKHYGSGILDPRLVSSSLHERCPPVDSVLMVQVGSQVDQQASDRQVATYGQPVTRLDNEH